MALLLLMAPLAPFITEELWERLNKHGSIHTAPWPVFDPEAMRAETMTLLVQVNGRVRDSVEVKHDVSETEIKRQALATHNIQRFIAAQTVSRVIYVPGRLVNIVAE